MQELVVVVVVGFAFAFLPLDCGIGKTQPCCGCMPVLGYSTTGWCRELLTWINVPWCAWQIEWIPTVFSSIFQPVYKQAGVLVFISVFIWPLFCFQNQRYIRQGWDFHYHSSGVIYAVFPWFWFSVSSRMWWFSFFPIFIVAKEEIGVTCDQICPSDEMHRKQKAKYYTAFK